MVGGFKRKQQRRVSYILTSKRVAILFSRFKSLVGLFFQSSDIFMEFVFRSMEILPFGVVYQLISEIISIPRWRKFHCSVSKGPKIRR